MFFEDCGLLEEGDNFVAGYVFVCWKWLFLNDNFIVGYDSVLNIAVILVMI